MTTRKSLHAAIDNMTNSVLAPTLVQFDNTNYETYSQGSEPFVSQKVSFRRNAQMELGRVAMRRQYGAVMFLIHVRKGTGTGVKDTLAGLLVDSFSSNLLDGATFQDANELPLGESGDWAVTGIEIPFYFQRLR